MALAVSPAFTRGHFTNLQFKNLPRQKDLSADSVYAIHAKTPQVAGAMLAKHITCEDTLKITRLVLGDDLFKKLLNKGGKDVLHVAAEVIDDQLNRPGIHTKDLQLNLVCNMVKEIVFQQDIHRAKACAAAETVMDKLGLGLSFRREVENALLNNGAIYQSFLVIANVA